MHLLYSWDRLRPHHHICDFQWKIVCLKSGGREDTSYIHINILLLYIIYTYYYLEQQTPSKQQRGINTFQPLLSYKLISVCPESTSVSSRHAHIILVLAKAQYCQGGKFRGKLISFFQWKKKCMILQSMILIFWKRNSTKVKKHPFT